MASSRNLLRASLCAVLLAAGGCGDLKKTGALTGSDAKWRTATVETVQSVRVTNGESRGARAAVGFLAAGPIGAIVSAGAAEQGMGTSSAWEYALRDGDNRVTVRSFSVVGPGDCIRYAVNIAGEDVPLERVAQELCAPQ